MSEYQTDGGRDGMPPFTPKKPMSDYTKKLWATMTVPCPDDRSPEDWLKEWVFKAIEQAIKDTQYACFYAYRAKAQPYNGDIGHAIRTALPKDKV